eukprot:1532665-Heterocapsa_arctica.AAC.1
MGRWTWPANCALRRNTRKARQEGTAWHQAMQGIRAWDKAGHDIRHGMIQGMTWEKAGHKARWGMRQGRA